MNRFREQDNRFYGLSGTQTVSNTAGVVTTATIYDDGSFHTGGYKSMSDVVVPNFSKKSSEGMVFNNPMSSQFYQRTFAGSLWGYTITKVPPQTQDYRQTITNGVQTLNACGGQVGHLPINLNVLRLQELAGTEARAGVVAPDFAGSTFIGELRETISFLRRPTAGWLSFAKRMQRLKAQRARSFSPGDIRRKKLQAQSVFDFASDNWLRYRYGVKPLVSDMMSFRSAVQKLSKPKPKRYTARGNASDSGEETNTSEFTYGVGTYERTATTSRSLTVRAGILYETDFSDSFGLGLEYIPVTLWETLTLSFVADWFLNIGTFLEALTPKQGVRYLASWTSMDDTWTTSSNAQLVKLADVSGKKRNIFANGATSETFTTHSKSRQPGTKIGLNSKPLPFRGDLGTRRIIDSVALTGRILRSR